MARAPLPSSRPAWHDMDHHQQPEAAEQTSPADQTRHSQALEVAPED